MKAAIYARVSTEEQAKHGYSLIDQRAACREKAVALGAKDIVEFIDDGVSGELLEGRPGLSALREAVRGGQVDLVVCYDPDRLARNLAHQLLVTNEIEKAGVRLEFVNFEWQNTPDGRLFYALRGAIAEYEKEKIRERTLRGKIQKARQGKLPIGVQPYGYIYEDGTLKPHPVESEVVRAIYHWFTTENIGMNGVALRLTARGVPTRNGRPEWHRGTIRRILTDPTYAGTWYYNRYDCKGYRYNRFLPPEERVRPKLRPESEWISVPVPAIVDRETWEKAQEKVRAARRLWSGWSRQKYLLSGLVSCTDCGNPMHGMTKTKRGGSKARVRGYTCMQLEAGRHNPGCSNPHKWVKADIIEDAVWRHVKSWLNDPEALAREIRRKSGEKELREEMERIEKHLAEVERGRDNIRSALAAGLLDLDPKTAKTLAELKNREKQLAARKSEIETTLHQLALAETRFKELKRQAADFLSRLDELSFEQKKALLRTLVRQVTVTGRGKDVRITVYANFAADVAATLKELSQSS